jgi:hypothetical protein
VRIADEEGAVRRHPRSGHQLSRSGGVRLGREPITASDDRKEALGDAEPQEKPASQRSRLVREHGERCSVVAENGESLAYAAIQPGVVDKMPLVVTQERGEHCVGLIQGAAGRRKTPSDEASDALPNESEDRFLGERSSTDIREGRIRRIREVFRGIDEGPVEVEDVVAEAPQTENEDPQPQVRSAFGLMNLKPAPWRPST